MKENLKFPNSNQNPLKIMLNKKLSKGMSLRKSHQPWIMLFNPKRTRMEKAKTFNK